MAVQSELELYYIQNVGHCGNCLRWWNPDGKGYTLDLNKAWKVSREMAEQICRSRPNEDIPWPVHLIDDFAARHLNAESLPLEMRRKAAGNFQLKVQR